MPNCDNKSSLTPEGFNDFFISNVSNIIQNVPAANHSVDYYLDMYKQTLSEPLTASFSFGYVTVEQVYDAILSLKNSASLDVYCLNSFVLKLAAPYVCEVLCYLFNVCIDSSVFPKCLKLAKVIPLLKKGSVLDYNNYRPISIIPVVSKVFEIILYRQIFTYFENNSLFTDCQFGFRPNRGTGNAIAEFMKNCLLWLDGKDTVLGSFYDMSKAFDTVTHRILVYKFKFYGFDDAAIEFILSYLSDRFQAVFYNGCFSHFLEVLTGVPQGSTLGPIFFIIYINDLAAALLKNYYGFLVC